MTYPFSLSQRWHREIDVFDTMVTGPSIEPLDLEEVKKPRRFSSTSLDTLFDMWISASRQDFEMLTGLALLTQEREQSLDCFPYCNELELVRTPVQSVLSIKYDDGSGTEQTFDPANYYLTPAMHQAEPYPFRARIALVSGGMWPIAALQPKAVRIRYVCGFGDAPGDVPELIAFALSLFVGVAHRYSEDLQEFRGSLLRLPMGAQQIIRLAQMNTLSTLAPRRW